MERMELRVLADRHLKARDPLSFFYPPSEWDMDQPLQCNCRTGGESAGIIYGAKNMKGEVLWEYWLNPHIGDGEEEGGGLVLTVGWIDNLDHQTQWRLNVYRT
jgi:hypothetical protein